MKKPKLKPVYGNKGVPLFAQDATISQSGYHAKQGTLAANEPKATKSPILPSRNEFRGSRAQLIADLRAKGPPKSTNWRTSAIPISHRNRRG